MFTIDEIISATRATLLWGDRRTVVGGISTDSRTIMRGEAFVALRGARFDAHAYMDEVTRKGASCVIAEDTGLPDGLRPPALIKVADTTAALGDIARYHRGRLSIPVVGVTGSNGKTTTKEMIAALLSPDPADVQKTAGTRNNHIGVPQTVLSITTRHRAAVVEMGTNHPGEIAYVAGICRPTIGVVTSVGPSHLEFLKSIRGVEREKMSMVKFLTSPAVLIVNADDPLLYPYLVKPPRGIAAFGYGIRKKTDFRACVKAVKHDRVVFTVNGRRRITLRALGIHNVYNSLAAVACARILGIGYGDINSRLAAFVPPAGRMRLVEHGNIRFIDDTYNANPLSVQEALATLARMKVAGRKIAVIGDMRELGRFQDSFHHRVGVDAAKVCDALITVGEASRHAARGARVNGLGEREVFVCATVEEARGVLSRSVRPKGRDIILVKGSRSMGMERLFDAL